MTVLPPPQSGSSSTPYADSTQDSSPAFAWLRFTQPAVRDLAFALASPPLLASWPAELQPALPIELFTADFWHSHYVRYLPRLLALDLDPTALNDALTALSSTRLGVRFEALLSFWLKDKSGDWHDYLLLAQNIQLKDHKRTTGEIDFLIENQSSGEVEHWELSLKFYLGEAGLAPFDWRGLNDRDSFGRKIRHTLQHQFNVSEIQHPDLGLKTIQKRRAVFKGRLFYPDAKMYAAADLTSALDWLHPAHLRGSWGYELPQGIDWRRAARREWLTPTASAASGQNLYFLSHGLYLGYHPESTQQLDRAPIERMIRSMPQRAPFMPEFYARLYR